MTPSVRQWLSWLFLAVAPVLGTVSPAAAQAVTPAYAGSYSLQVLGAIPGLPAPYGGVTFLDGNTLLIGGAANTPSGTPVHHRHHARRRRAHHRLRRHRRGLRQRGREQRRRRHVRSRRRPVHHALQPERTRSNETRQHGRGQGHAADAAGHRLERRRRRVRTARPSGCGPVQGRVSYNASRWYTVPLTPDGSGTYTLGAPTVNIAIVGGPEGIAYVPPGSPLFPVPAVLVSEYAEQRDRRLTTWMATAIRSRRHDACS